MLDKILESLSDIALYITIATVIIVIAFLEHGKSNVEQNNIEERSTKQEQYMHEVQAEIDNLKEV